MSSSWDFAGHNSRLNVSADSGMIDLKALLNQVTGGGLGGLTAPLGGLGSGLSGGRTGQRIGSNGGFASNPAGVIGGGIGCGSGGMDTLSMGGSSTNNGFFDPFSSMSTFGFFNPKDPGSNQPMDNRNNSTNMGDRNNSMGDRTNSMGDRNMSMGDRSMSMGERNNSMGDRNMGMGDRNSSMGDRNSSMGDRNSSMGDRNSSMGDRNSSMMDRNSSMMDRNSSMGDRNNMGMGGDRNTGGGMGMGGGYGMGHSKSPPTYGHGQRMNSSPIFGGNHSPINFFGGGPTSSSGHHQQNQFSSSSSSNFGGGGNGGNSQNSKFSIGTFSIDDTIPGRERTDRESNSSMFGSSDNNGISSNNHNQYGGSGSEKNMFASGYRDRDNYGNSSNSGGNSSNNHGSGITNRTNEHGDNAFNQGVRETGIIEKLLHSYGFIQCCERQARLFFHFSQFDGTIEHLKLGDPVEFEMTYDRRTGKPIASAVTKIGPEVVLSEERVSGTVTTELHQESSGELQVSSQAQVKGRISYENRGECFFLPYCSEDIEGSVTLSVGDTVSFQIATNQRSGNLTARYVRLENPARPVRYKGIVSSLKDNFGFIERADVAKEIFFHFSETRIIEAITISDNVEFNIQTRSGKEVACAITKLPVGTVVFEDIGTDTLKGQILKPIDKTQCPSPTIGPTPRSESSEGRLRYRGPDRQELEVVYGEKDMKGSFTMRHGDWVQFQLAVDRRNKQQRATNVTLLEESFSVSGERREEGVISALKGDCGYISCAERDSKMFFRLPELLDYTRQPRIADDVEFTIIQDPTSPIRQSAIRIRYLKPGTVQFEIPVSQGLHGVVVREPSTPWVSQEALAGILPSLSNLGLPANVTERLIQSLSSAEVLAQLTGGGSNVPDPQGGGEPGVIQYQSPNGWQSDTIIFHWKDCKNLRNIRVGTKVVFDIHQVRRNRDLVASNIRADELDDTYSIANLTNNSTSNSGLVHLQQNYRVSPTEQLGGHNHTNNISISNGPMSPPEMLGIPGPPVPIGSAEKKRLTQEDQHAALMTAAALRNGAINYPQSSSAPMTNSNLKSNSMDDYLLTSELGNNTPDRNLEMMHSSSRYDRDSPPLQNGLYSRCSLGGADDSDGGGADMMRRGSRSPTDNYDKGVTNGGMYSSYGSETPSSSSPSSGCGGGSSSKNPRVVMKGYIAALKDGFGFIETMAQDGEIFFHSSSLVGDFATLEVGQEVEYVVSSKASSSGKNAADIVKPLPKGSIGRAAVFPDILTGLVSRPLRGANPDQTEYTGLIDGCDGLYYPFGIISMLNKKELLQAGEAVEFQLDAQGKPVNIRAIRKKLRAAVEAVKGQYGFLSYELDDGKKLFFHMSEVKDHQHLNPGDEVEFVILQNPRNGKSSACNVVKVGESQRPERLLNRLSKLSVDESAPRLVAVRQPYGPDGTRGFTQPRVPRKVGALSSRESTSSSI